jgi:hypothetical protein
MRGEICGHCQYAEVPKAAQDAFESQPTTTASVTVGDGDSSVIYHVSRHIDPEVRARMITDPTPARAALDTYLEVHSCNFVKTGRCAVADFAVEATFNQPM